MLSLPNYDKFPFLPQDLTKPDSPAAEWHRKLLTGTQPGIPPHFTRAQIFQLVVRGLRQTNHTDESIADLYQLARRAYNFRAEALLKRLQSQPTLKDVTNQTPRKGQRVFPSFLHSKKIIDDYATEAQECFNYAESCRVNANRHMAQRIPQKPFISKFGAKLRAAQQEAYLNTAWALAKQLERYLGSKKNLGKSPEIIRQKQERIENLLESVGTRTSDPQGLQTECHRVLGIAAANRTHPSQNAG